MHEPAMALDRRILNEELGPKRLELLRDLVPKAVLVGLLVNPTNPNAKTLSRAIQAAVGAFGLRLHTIAVSRKEELANVFETLVQMTRRWTRGRE